MPAAIDWTPELETSILEGIEEGLTIREVAELHSISDSLILKKVRENPEFCKQYARVIDVRTDRDFEGLRDELKEQPAMISTKFGDMIDPSWVALKRLQIDTRKWELSKRVPKKYGDTTNMNVNVQVSRIVVQDETPGPVIEAQIQPALPRPEFED